MTNCESGATDPSQGRAVTPLVPKLVLEDPIRALQEDFLTMFDLQLQGRVDLRLVGPLPAHIDRWLKGVQELDDWDLQDVIALTAADDEVDAMRKAVGLCPALAKPGRALGARFADGRDEFVMYAFRLRSLACILDDEERDAAMAMDVHSWCQAMLERRATSDDLFAARFVRWCAEMSDKFADAAARDASPAATTDDGPSTDQGDETCSTSC